MGELYKGNIMKKKGGMALLLIGSYASAKNSHFTRKNSPAPPF